MKSKPISSRKKTAGASRARRPARAPGAKLASQQWMLRLYVAGQTPKALAAFASIKRICEDHLAGRYKIEVIDLARTPQLAVGDQIIALPTLVRKLPPPIKRIIGDLSNMERVLVGMDLRPKKSLKPAQPLMK